MSLRIESVNMNSVLIILIVTEIWKGGSNELSYISNDVSDIEMHNWALIQTSSGIYE
jgi:hypothetical protein